MESMDRERAKLEAVKGDLVLVRVVYTVKRWIPKCGLRKRESIKWELFRNGRYTHTFCRLGEAKLVLAREGNIEAVQAERDRLWPNGLIERSGR